MNKKEPKIVLGGASHAEEKRESLSVSRRSFTFGALGALALFGLGGITLLPAKPLCRPPGGQDESAFLEGCIHCERCREICPRTAVAPTKIEKGILVARTPSMNFKQGWCDFCEEIEGGPRCIAVCPTNALRKDSEISEVIIGKAVLNRDWCLAAKGMGCHVCVDECNYEALELGYDNVPVVDFDACNGCGACEYVCISLSSGSITVGATDRAIVVMPTEEAEEIREIKAQEAGASL